MSEPRAARWIAGASSVLCLAIALWLALDATRARSTAGFWHVASHDTHCASDPSWRTERASLVAEPFHAELLHAADAIGRRAIARRCDVYRGYLVVRAPSRLSLEVHATGDTRVILGKQQLIGLDVGAVRITRRVERPIPAGAHLVEIRTTQEGQLAYLRLSALLEPEDRVTAVPLETRALLPLEHDLLAPSLADAERVRADAGFERRSASRLAALLALLVLALALPALPELARRGRRELASAGPSASALAATLAIALVGWLSWDPARSPVDPHFLGHGARAWRTLWLGLPTRSIVDAIPALGPTEWVAGAGHALGGLEGPAVLAIAIASLAAALTVATAHLAAGPRAAWIALVLVVGHAVLTRTATLDRAALWALGLAASLFLATWLATRTRLARGLARASRRLSPLDRAHPASSARVTRPRKTTWALVLLASTVLASVGLLAPSALVPALLPLLALSLTAAAEAL